jgi:ANTAR domain
MPSSVTRRASWRPCFGADVDVAVIEQAKNVISERAGADLAEAFSRLRGCARKHNFRLADVAQAAVDGALDPRAWAPPPS